MFFPAMIVDVNDFASIRRSRGIAIPAGMAPMFVIIDLVVPELVLQVSGSPEKGLI